MRFSFWKFDLNSILLAALVLLWNTPTGVSAFDENELPVRRIEVSHDIEKDGQVIVFDLGKQMPSSRINAVLNLTNKTGAELKLGLKPSCNCTHLSVNRLNIPADNSEKIAFELVVPMAGVKQAFIDCRDEERNLGCAVDVKIEASVPLKFASDKIVTESNSELPLEVRILKGSGTLEIGEAVLAAGSRWRVQRVEADTKGWSLFLERVAQVEKGFHEEYLRLDCVVVDDERRISIPMDFRIEFSDRFRLGPSFVLPKLIADKVSFTIFATGASIRTQRPPKITLIGGNEAIELEVRLDGRRTRNGSLFLDLEMDKQEFEQLKERLGLDEVALELNLGGVTSRTKLKMEFTEKQQ